MARKFRELVEKLPPERQAAIKAGADQLRMGMALDELREALKLTQESLAQSLHVTQASISKVERRSDMFISTLRKIIEAMGGELEIRAILPDGVVRINQFEEVRRPVRAKQFAASVGP